MERLIEHERFKNAAEMLQQKRMIEKNVWSNPQIEQFLCRKMTARAGGRLVRPGEDASDESGTGKKPSHLRDRQGRCQRSGHDSLVRYELERMAGRQSLSATRLFERQRSRRAMICLFLAILELVKCRQ